MTSARTLHVAVAVAKRSLRVAYTNPAIALPSILFPMIFLVGFAGGLSAIDDVPGFDFPSGYTAFQYVFVFLQSAAFGGVFTGFAIARDFEFGFAKRLLLAAPHRGGIVLGYVFAGLGRWALTASVITVAALLAGMQVGGGVVDLFGLVGLGLMVNMIATLWGTGVAMRLRTVQAGPLMQMPVFVILFLAPVYVPLDLLSGWIHTVASFNPATAFVQAGRGFISGRPDLVAVAYAVAASMVAIAAVWALGGLRRAEREI
ncbi:ABC transporter permease [Paraconexibacter sp.]|uniref:ABC transporter permease n=1 Tax=Paraconexibacter sp. TaxID=2949640 RepID=UPI00356A5156